MFVVGTSLWGMQENCSMKMLFDGSFLWWWAKLYASSLFTNILGSNCHSFMAWTWTRVHSTTIWNVSPTEKFSEQININAIVPNLGNQRFFANFMQQIYDAATFHILLTKLCDDNKPTKKKTHFAKRKRGKEEDGWTELTRATQTLKLAVSKIKPLLPSVCFFLHACWCSAELNVALHSVHITHALHTNIEHKFLNSLADHIF